jgi:UDPglucose 6-dehydrogenase
MKHIQSVGVIGHKGMVGTATYRYFTENGFDTYGYSKSSQEEKDEVNNADCVFICVPTPYDWQNKRFDGSIVESVLKEIVDGTIVVIKSTIPIGTTNRLQEMFSHLKLLFNPEFLSEATAYADFINPDRQFVGYTENSYDVAIDVLNILPDSAYGAIMPSKEAELLKYINNLHGFLAVIEANHYFDVCVEEGLDYERVMRASHASKWVGAPMGRQYHNIFHKGYRGVGGACFPKDINAWLEWANEQGIDTRLMTTVRDINKDILASQELTEAEAEKK